MHFSLNALKVKSQHELLQIQKEFNISASSKAKKQDILNSIVKHLEDNEIIVFNEGVLDIPQENYGFLRCVETSYFSSHDDVYVSANLIKKYSLKRGDTIKGTVRAPKDNEKYPALKTILLINFKEPGSINSYIPFENLTPEYPKERLYMEAGNGSSEDITSRLIDLAAPIGKGQRGLIVAPPKAGKTMLLQSIASSITHNNKECFLIVLLIGERPEEVTEMRRQVKGEVVASTFDEPASRHVQLAETVIEKAIRLVECKYDVVILLDSITRLARAYNSITPASGRVLSGGIDAQALHKPKRFFGAARNTSEGGSLTIISSALVDTGSKMDEVIFEEFKGTGNMEIHLQRKLADKRVFPAIQFSKSGTRRDDLLSDVDERQKLYLIRRLIEDMDEGQAVEFLIEKMKTTKTNKEFLQNMGKINRG